MKHNMCFLLLQRGMAFMPVKRRLSILPTDICCLHFAVGEVSIYVTTNARLLVPFDASAMQSWRLLQRFGSCTSRVLYRGRRDGWKTVAGGLSPASKAHAYMKNAEQRSTGITLRSKFPNGLQAAFCLSGCYQLFRCFWSRSRCLFFPPAYRWK